MRLHFAAGLILELAYQNLKSITKVGAYRRQSASILNEPKHFRLPMLTVSAAPFPPITRSSAFSDEEHGNAKEILVCEVSVRWYASETHG
jgi:hypothetical protein